MEEKWKALYEELNLETAPILRTLPFTVEDAEACYKIGLNYWKKARDVLRHNGFGTEAQEIAFFSTVKPRFTGQLEYFMLLYQYRLFCPPDKPDIVAFREHEIDKIRRFRDIHANFLRFYRSRQKDPPLAQQYFLRRTFNPDRRTYVRPFDTNPYYFTNGDWIVSQFIGTLRYHRFLSQEQRQPRPPTGDKNNFR
jgi:hypothetical protein